MQGYTKWMLFTKNHSIFVKRVIDKVYWKPKKKNIQKEKRKKKRKDEEN